MFVFVCVYAAVCMLSVHTASTVWVDTSYKGSLHCALWKGVIQNQSSDVWSERAEEWEEGRQMDISWGVVGWSAQYDLTWTMSSSHSGAEFFLTGAMAEALLSKTSETALAYIKVPS